MRDVSETSSYAMVQVLSDLHSVAAKGFSELADRMDPRKRPVLTRLIFEQNLAMTEDCADSLYQDVMDIASQPDADFDCFCSATALLLSDLMQGGAARNDLRGLWAEHQDRYRDAPASIRAALMNGFRGCHAARRIVLRDMPAEEDLHTYDSADLRRMLISLARSMDDATRDAVCALGTDGTVPVHRSALENCLRGSCLLSEYGRSFPGDVVDLASQIPDHPGFAPCMALVLLDAIETRDASGRMAKRWETHAEDFNVLPAEHRAVIIAGVRHLHEMGFDWCPYDTWAPQMIMEKAVVVPFVRP